MPNTSQNTRSIDDHAIDFGGYFTFGFVVFCMITDWCLRNLGIEVAAGWWKWGRWPLLLIVGLAMVDDTRHYVAHGLRNTNGKVFVGWCFYCASVFCCWHGLSIHDSKPQVKLTPVSSNTIEPMSIVQIKISELNQKITKLRTARDTFRSLFDNAVQEKVALVQRIRDLGVFSSADLQIIPRAKPYAESLQRMSGEVEKYERDVGRLESAIADANGLMRRFKRAEALAGMGLDDEIASLSEQAMNLDESVDGVSATAKPDLIQSTDLLDRELKGATRR